MIARLLLCVCLASTLALPCAATTAGPLTINGSARVLDGKVELTSGGVSENATLFTTQPVDISRFDTSFTFQMSSSEEQRADGLTFCIQNDPRGATAMGSLGGYLGYGVSSSWNTHGITKSVAVEFDDYYNGFFSDSPSDHVGVDVDASVVSVAQAMSPITLAGEPVNARVVYDGVMLSIYLWRGNEQPDLPYIQYWIDIPGAVGASSAYVGFTSATATYTQFTDVAWWRFGSTEYVPVRPSPRRVEPAVILD